MGFVYQLKGLALLALIASSATSSAESQTASCKVPFSNAPIDEIAKWASESGDLLRDFYLRDPSSSDMPTSIGTLIDQSCWSKRSPKDYRLWLERVESALAYAITQVKRCEQVLGFPELSDLIPKIRRMRISCGNWKGFVMAAEHGGSSSPRLNRDYELKDWGEYADKLQLEGLAESIVHEALHWAASNNRGWHNKAHSRSKSGCNNSLFSDRIYLISSACFPMSDLHASYFYDGAYACPGVCESALTEVDSDALNWWVRTFTQGSELQIAKPSSNREASIICNRIRTARDRYRFSKETGEDLVDRAVMLETFLRKKGEIFPKEFLTIVGQIKHTIEMAYTPEADLQSIRRKLRIQRDQVGKVISEACRKIPDEKRSSSLCGTKGNRMIELITAAQNSIGRLSENDLLLYAPAQLKKITRPVYERRKR